MKRVTAYKLARPDGWDFYTGKTIMYRSSVYPHKVKVPQANSKLGLCSPGVGHASANPNDCFVGAKIPCSAFRIRFVPVCQDSQKFGWTEAEVLEEIFDLDKLLGWKYAEACNPINPFKLSAHSPEEQDWENLKLWASVGDSVRSSVWASVGDSVRSSVWASVGSSVWGSVWASVGDSVRSSVWGSVWASVGSSVWGSVEASVEASVGAYIGHLFPGIENWLYVEHEVGKYPFQPAVDLWLRGLVPSYDGKIWRLHSGPEAKIVWAGNLPNPGQKGTTQ